jgi:hypothetical protein
MYSDRNVRRPNKKFRKNLALNLWHSGLMKMKEGVCLKFLLLTLRSLLLTLLVRHLPNERISGYGGLHFRPNS